MSTVWTAVKKASELVLSGVEVEIDKTDTTINGVTFTDEKGNKLRVRLSSYNMYVEVPAKPKTVEKFAVKGSVAGLRVEEVFDSKYTADSRKEELISAVRYGCEDEKLEVEPIQVNEEDW